MRGIGKIGRVISLIISSESMSNSSDIQRYLLAQFEDAEAQKELKGINYEGFDWVKRTRNTIIRASSLFPKIGSAIKTNLELEFNAGSLLKAEYAKGEPLVKSVENKSAGLRNRTNSERR